MALTRRLASVLVALGLGATGSLLAVSPASADAVKVTYACTIPGFGTQDIDIALSTNAPATMAVGATANPSLQLTVTIPSSIIGLAKIFGYTHASAEGTLGVGINGAVTSLGAEYPKTKIPDSGDFDVDITLPLPALKPTAAGTIVYTPGPLNAEIAIYQGEADASPTTAQADCDVKNPSPVQVIDTVTVTGATASTTTVVAPTATYGKPATATVTVSNADGKPVTGSVTLSGAGPMQKKAVTNGRAVFTLSKALLARAYQLRADYSGSSALKPSQRTISFKVAKANVTNVGFGLTAKPTARKTGRGSIVVKAPAGLPAPTGKVTLVLTKGGVKKTVVATLKGGKKAVVLPKLAKGTWNLAATYGGNANYNALRKLYVFKVTS